MSKNSLLADASLQANWRLQETSGSTVADSSSNARNGTMLNMAPSSTAGPGYGIAAALVFDGTDDELSLSNNAALKPTGDFTLGCWVNTPSSPSRDTIGFLTFDTGSTDVYLLRYKNSGAASAIGYSGFLRASSTYNLLDNTNRNGSWVHTVLRRSGNTLDLLINGVVEETASVSGSNSYGTFGTQNLVAGTSSPGSGTRWAGSLADVFFYDRALSDAEVLEWRDGYEPLNTVAPTLTISTTTWTGTIGTWDSQSNGTLTYAWELRDADDDSVVESGTGSSPSGSGSYSGSYYLWVRGSNDGGYDTAEDSVSADETASGGGTTVTPSIATLTLTTFAPTVTATANKVETPTTASLTTSAFAPTVTATANQVATPTNATLSLTTFAPTVDVSSANTVTPQTATLALAAFAPTVTATENIVATPASASLSLSAFAPTVSTASGSITATPTTASLTLTTFAPSLSAPSQSWTIAFNGNESCSGGLTATLATGDLTAMTTTDDLVVSQLEPV